MRLFALQPADRRRNVLRLAQSARYYHSMFEAVFPPRSHNAGRSGWTMVECSPRF